MQDQLKQYLVSTERSEQFAAACNQTLDELRAANGIGTLAEKSTHAVLKRFFAELPEYEEVKAYGFVADIYRPEGIIEVQTRNFNTMRRKLHAFLPECPVTIVYPVMYKKSLCWIDPESGEVTKPRRSSKTDYGFRIFAELYRIKDFVRHPNLTIRLALMEVTEYKMLDGYGEKHKIRASRNDGIPNALLAEISLHTPQDYLYFLPVDLPDIFTSADLAKCAKISRNLAGIALNILLHVGTLEKLGKKGNSYLYEISKDF